MMHNEDLHVNICAALPIVGAWSMAVLLWQLFEYYYYCVLPIYY